MTDQSLPQEDVAKVAASLTKAQREAIYPGPGNPQYARAKSRLTMAALHRAGIIPYTPSYGGCRLTPLGEAIRSHLLGEKPRD